MEWFLVVIPAAFVGYAYLGYPVLIAILARLRPLPVAGAARGQPVVAVVVPSYNGFRYLQAKLDSLRLQTYDQAALRLIFVSDGSTDQSVEFLKSQPDVSVLELPQRSGKPSALNLARSALPADAEIVVLTDVRQTLSANAITDLVATLQDSAVGIAGGELVQVTPDGAAAPIGLYWRYEKAIRRFESRFFSTVGTSGALYAVRARDLPTLPEDTILDDFEIPLKALRQGRRTVLVDGAIAYDQAESEIAGEWTRKVRTLTGNFQSLWRNPWLLHPTRNPAWFQFVSHKLLRLLVPYALLVMVLASLLSASTPVRLFGLAQLLFYLLGLASLVFPALSRRFKPAGIAGTFIALNAAAVVALVRFLGGNYRVTWQQTR